MVLDTALYTYTAPDDDTCINATYHVRAEINVTELLDYTFTAPNIPFVSGEIQAYWDNNIVGDALTGRRMYLLTYRMLNTRRLLNMLSGGCYSLPF